MMQNILWLLLMSMVEIGGGYIAYRSFTNNVKQKLEKEWQDKNEQLNFWEKNLSSRYSQMEERDKIEIAHIARKKSEAAEELNKASNAIKIAWQIKEDANLRIKNLQKRMDQLQSELFKSRKRSERLANKLKNTVQIKALD